MSRSLTTIHTSLRIVLALLIATFGALLPHASYAQSAKDSAIQMVEKQKLGNNLTNIGMVTASRTQPFKKIVEKLGEAQGTALLKSEIDRFAPKYQKQWDENLAIAYASVLTPAELNSMASEGQGSKHMQKMVSVQSEVATKMQASSSKLLNEFITDALRSAYMTTFAEK